MAIQHLTRKRALCAVRHASKGARNKASHSLQFATNWLAVNDRVYRLCAALFILAGCLAVPAITGDPRHPFHAAFGLLMLAVRP